MSAPTSPPTRRPILPIALAVAFVAAVAAAFVFVPGLSSDPPDPSLDVTARFRPSRWTGVTETGTAYDTATIDPAGAAQLVLCRPTGRGVDIGASVLETEISYRVVAEPDQAGRIDLFLAKSVRHPPPGHWSRFSSGESLQISVVRHQIRVWQRATGGVLAIAVSPGVHDDVAGTWVSVLARVPKGLAVRYADKLDPEFADWTPENELQLAKNLWREVKQTPVPKADFPK